MRVLAAGCVTNENYENCIYLSSAIEILLLTHKRGENCDVQNGTCVASFFIDSHQSYQQNAESTQKCRTKISRPTTYATIPHHRDILVSTLRRIRLPWPPAIRNIASHSVHRTGQQKNTQQEHVNTMLTLAAITVGRRVPRAIVSHRYASSLMITTSFQSHREFSPGGTTPAFTTESPVYTSYTVQCLSSRRSKSTAVAYPDENDDSAISSLFQPTGDLFDSSRQLRGGSVEPTLVGRKASIRRVFGPSANAQGLLTCGGEELARHASFDPDYETAKGYIRSRAIGPAVLSPILISGLVGALVEASLPQTVVLQSSMSLIRPLIVGVEVCATVQVESVMQTHQGGNHGLVQDGEPQQQPQLNVLSSTEKGYEIVLSTEVVRVQDDAAIAKGKHTVWLPSYLTM